MTFSENRSRKEAFLCFHNGHKSLEKPPSITAFATAELRNSRGPATRERVLTPS